MANPVYIQDKEIRPAIQHHPDRHSEGFLTNKQRRQLQHEFKTYLEKYFKRLIGKAADSTKITIWDNMMIYEAEGFLTEPEKFIARDQTGAQLINASRKQICKQFAIDCIPYFEGKIGAKCIYQTSDIGADQNIWIHTMIFDRVLIDFK